MVIKKIKYKDFNGVEREEEFMFNLTEAEITEMELMTDGGLSDSIKRIIAAQDTPQIIETFKNLLLKSYGQKSADGRLFIKNKKLTEEFTQTNAYSQFFMELATDDKAAIAFINGIIPDSMRERVADTTTEAAPEN
nr:MAG TPA: hypothetical protein [Caudoviricetes sp.]